MLAGASIEGLKKESSLDGYRPFLCSVKEMGGTIPNRVAGRGWCSQYTALKPENDPPGFAFGKTTLPYAGRAKEEK